MSDKKKLKVIVIIQARMGSTRLEGKILKKVLGKPLLSFLIERIQKCAKNDLIVVATTNESRDDQVVQFCQKENIACFRGSEENVLDRYYQAATFFSADIVIRVTGDCPLIDPFIIDEMISLYLKKYPAIDYLSTGIHPEDRTFPRGLDVEIFSYKCLEEAAKNATLPLEREHVTPYIYLHPDHFKIETFKNTKDLSFYRLTVDTQEDFELIKKILEEIYPKKRHFNLGDLIALLEEHPEWKDINSHIKQKSLGQ